MMKASNISIYGETHACTFFCYDYCGLDSVVAEGKFEWSLHNWAKFGNQIRKINNRLSDWWSMTC